MRAQTVVIMGILAIVMPALGAEDAERSVNLKPAGRVELSTTPSLDLVGAPKCDGSGNLYVRLVSDAGSDYFLAPIRAVGRDGKVTGMFSLAETWTNAVGRGVFVKDDGSVYQAVIAPDGVYIVHFAKDRSIRSQTRLETQAFFDPWHVVVFDSGRFLVSGVEGKNRRKPVAAVFEPDGRLVKPIYESEDDDARKRAESGDSVFTHDADTGNRFVDLGDVTLGSDGNAYLLHGTSPALVYVVSPTGDVIRKVKIGGDSSRFAFRDIESHAGRLAVGLAEFGRIEVYVTDLAGVPVATYALDTDKSEVPRLACYDNRGFSLVVRSSGGSVSLVSTKP